MVSAFPPGWVLLFFSGMKLMVPETKGVPLEDIEKQLGIV